MSKTDQLKELAEALIQSPPDMENVVLKCQEIIETYHSLLDNLEVIIKKSGITLIATCESIGITKHQYYRRLEDHNLWKKQELEKLFKTFNKKKK